MFWGREQDKTGLAKNVGDTLQSSASQIPLLPVRSMRGPRLAAYVAVLAIFGVLVPWQKGLQFLDPVFLIAYACLGGVFAGPAAVQSFDTLPKSVREAMRRVAGAVLFGELIVAILLVFGLGTVRLAHRGIFPLDIRDLIAGLVLGAALSSALAAMAAWVRMAYSASVARSALRAIFIVLLIAFVFRARWLPDVAWTGAAAGFAAAAVFLALLSKRVRA